jgi:hypothetical protein
MRTSRNAIAFILRLVADRFQWILQRSRPGQRVRYSVVLDGMPEVHLSRPPIAPREYIPWLWIYVPVVLKWFMLALRYRSLTLPTAANPQILSGGFRGETKSSYLGQVGSDHQRWIAQWTTISLFDELSSTARLRMAEQRMADSSLAYPLIAAPAAMAFGLCAVHESYPPIWSAFRPVRR